MNSTIIIDVTPENVQEETLFCIKDIKKPGFHAKREWFKKQYQLGLRMKILKDDTHKMIGFIEYIPVSDAWRPVEGKDFMFIHCMYISLNKNKNKGYGSLLIRQVENEAKKKKMDGMCVMASKGAWISDKRIFENNGFKQVDQRGRFELMSKKWEPKAKDPKLIDWTANQGKYQGWHLIYADQCPWHEKSVFDLLNTALDYGIDLQVTKLINSKEAKQAPSGYGVFSLLHDGRLIEDHYLSATRFRNILKKELLQEN
ncbi:GNAT family N-acetyltransferase [uncultured Eudoraea sp.]|uniref:GNAT family N-acetyltransferase n=1 Tax=uncultured Eudoraea sp. TaxID=1035614 RepID=UPI00261772AF|nr:GNAT family N-acetyltransferase [uncultured Eudoraea sp.]